MKRMLTAAAALSLLAGGSAALAEPAQGGSQNDNHDNHDNHGDRGDRGDRGGDRGAGQGHYVQKGGGGQGQVSTQGSQGAPRFLSQQQTFSQTGQATGGQGQGQGGSRLYRYQAQGGGQSQGGEGGSYQGQPGSRFYRYGGQNQQNFQPSGQGSGQSARYYRYGGQGGQTGAYAGGQGGSHFNGNQQQGRYQRGERAPDLSAGRQWNGQASGRWNSGQWIDGRRWDRDRGRWEDRLDDRRDYFRNYYAPRRFSLGAFFWPQGWYYRRWAYGETLPYVFFSQDYWLDDFDDYGLPPPPYGCEWVRYGSDAILVDVDTGEIVQVVYNMFY